jgi:hypothetical protein
MPPKKKLPESVVADFEKWIELGAPDPRLAVGKVTYSAKKEIDWDEARQFWSFRPVAKPSIPAVKDAKWPRTEVDRFILRELEKQNLKPAADADKTTLIRRLSYDLTGLPPTPEEIDAFLADNSRKAVEKVVDRLLQSPQFGERWGRHWLDVARYGESNGNVDNNLFPHAWRYRDYVVGAFNADKPFDRFITEQIAGDLLPADSPQHRNELLTATGFLALTSKPRAQNNPEFALDLVAEQIDVVTVATMGLTVACARCHDHKFDPIPQKEYYSVAAIFESSRMLYGDGGGNQNNNKNTPKAGLHLLTSDNPEVATDAEKLAAEVKEVRTELEQQKKRIERLLVNVRKRLVAEDAPSDAKAQQRIEKLLEKQPGKIESRLDGDEKKEFQAAKARVEELQKKIADLEKQPTAGGFAMGVSDAPKPVNGKVRLRGESAKVGDPVPRGFVTVGSLGSVPEIPETHSGRLELAQWITGPENPLTARVTVNRVWRHLFGRGIVPTVDNFGALGEKPTHPELLDHLAGQFRSDGWSIKRLIRSLVLSRTYQLASTHNDQAYAVDPDNTLQWRHSVRRLDGESLRDTILAVAGKLDLAPAKGSPVAKEGTAEVKNGIDRKFSAFEFAHRSVYLPMVRNAEPEVLVTFDLPDTELVVGDRSVTTVPAQSLFLLNSPWVVQQAQAFADRLLAIPNIDDAGRVQRAYRLAFGRPAKQEELQRLLGYLETAKAQQSSADKIAPASKTWALVCQTLFASAEFRYVE